MAQAVDPKIPSLSDWVPGIEWWRARFSEAEIDAGIAATRYGSDNKAMDRDSLTELVVCSLDPMPPYIRCREQARGYRHLTMMHDGHEWQRTEVFVGTEYRVRKRYVGDVMAAFTETMLHQRLPWTRRYTWRIYGSPLSMSDLTYAIYLDTDPAKKHAMLYVPLDALLRGDVNAIKTRTSTYAKQYNSEPVTSSLLGALESEMAARLFEDMITPVR